MRSLWPWKRLPNGGAFMHAIMEPRTVEGSLLEGRYVTSNDDYFIFKSVETQ